MNLSDLASRVARLDELSRGLAREVMLWKTCNDPLLFQERKTYLSAIQDALAGVETARVALVRAQQRLGEQSKNRECEKYGKTDRKCRVTPQVLPRQ